MNIAEKIRSVVEQGDIATVPFLVPGYPTLAKTEEALRFLSKLKVAAHETTIPVAYGWSERTSEIIKESHIVAFKNGITAEEVLSLYTDFRPNSYVLYEPTMLPSLDNILEKMRGRADAAILEKETVELLKFCSTAKKNEVDTIYSVAPRMDRSTMGQRVQASSAFVYLTTSKMTGGTLYSAQAIQETILQIKAIKDIPVLCGFGIRTVEDVKNIGSLEGCDGVIIGSSALEALKHGFDYFCHYFRKMIRASRGLKKTIK